jgi:hypothetical protein
MDGKEISQSSDLNLPPGAHSVILSAKGIYVQNSGKRPGESFLRAGIRQDNVNVKCYIFGHVTERIRLDRPLLRWPPRSPDLTPCDFFLWGYVKDVLFVPPLPTYIDDLKRRITEAVAAVALTCCDECGKSWIIDFTSAASHVGLTSSACKV